MPSRISSCLATIALFASSASAFSTVGGASSSKSQTALFARTSEQQNEHVSSRRDILRNVAGLAFGVTATLSSNVERADASYSAYSNREKDWQERQESGEVNFSSARDLKAQLKEIAPMNSAKSQVWCPNGPSSAVSPLMENKCNDRETMPSVFGRTEDVMGNSIPGFKGGKYPAQSVGGTTSLSAEVGFPSYK